MFRLLTRTLQTVNTNSRRREQLFENVLRLVSREFPGQHVQLHTSCHCCTSEMTTDKHSPTNLQARAKDKQPHQPAGQSQVRPTHQKALEQLSTSRVCCGDPSEFSRVIPTTQSSAPRDWVKSWVLSTSLSIILQIEYWKRGRRGRGKRGATHFFPLNFSNCSWFLPFVK